MFREDNYSLGKCLEKENTDCLKGICAVMVVIHHLFQNIFSGNILHNIFIESLGFLAVSAFFLFSGYGLMFSYIKTNGKYRDNFIRHRIFPFYVDCLLLTFIYSILYLLIGKHISLKLIIGSLTFGTTIIKYGWYLQVILLFYILFYVAAMIFKSPKKILLCTTFGIILYTIASYSIKFGDWWYVSVKSILSLSLGMCLAIYKEQLFNWLTCKKKFIVIFLLLLVLFIMLALLNNFIAFIPEILIFISCSVVFPLLIIIGSAFINVKCFITKELGKLSFEIYVLQGFFMLLYHSKVINISNNIIYVVVVSISILISSYLLRIVFQKIHHLFG